MNKTFGFDGQHESNPHSARERGGSKRRVGLKWLLKLLQQQEYKCALSGRELTPETADIDHIKPLAKGGRHSADNVQVIHSHVNRAKGTLLPDEFVQMCREVVEWTEKHGFKTGEGGVLSEQQKEQFPQP
jgi:5-methylcytosine-specific restriction endonuclease McrA